MSDLYTSNNIPGLAIVSAMIGAVVAFIGAAIHNARQSRAKVDEDLRDTRTKLYKPLWTQTQILPRWPRNKYITYGQLAQLSQTLSAWYFTEGGIYLSSPARKAYGHLQDSLKRISDKEQHPGTNQDSKAVSDHDYEAALKRCVHLRKELTKDLVSRSKIFGGD